jgi:hypothetical protein
MSHDDASRLEALPIQVDNEGVLVVALAEPTETRLMALRTLLGDNIDFVVVAKGAIEAGLRSDLLARSRSAFGQFDSEPAPAPAEPETAPVFFEPTAPETEPSPRSSIDSQLDSLRTLFAEAEEQRERDRLEIERLRAELADRDADLAERDESLRSAEQLLRDLADRLARPQD